MTRTLLVLALFLAALSSGFLMKLLPARESFMQKEVGKPLDGPAMGPYDGKMGGWSTSEEPMPVGSLPQNQALEQNKLMHLVNNSVSSSCCPDSALASDTGCVCLTASDRKQMNSRFGNK
jgi:hypothetical protein